MLERVAVKALQQVTGLARGSGLQHFGDGGLLRVGGGVLELGFEQGAGFVAQAGGAEDLPAAVDFVALNTSCRLSPSARDSCAKRVSGRVARTLVTQASRLAWSVCTAVKGGSCSSNHPRELKLSKAHGRTNEHRWRGWDRAPLTRTHHRQPSHALQAEPTKQNP